VSSDIPNRRRFLRTLSVLLVSAAALAASDHVEAQGIRAVGGLAGWVEGDQLIARQDASDTRSGLMAGLFIDVATQAPWLDIVAEGYVVQRGGNVPVDGLVAEVETDYLAFAVLPKGRIDVGPVSLFAYAGPNLDYHLRTKAGGELAVVYRRASPQVFGVALGAGMELDVGNTGSLRVELRHDRQLTGAFPDAPTDVNHRSRALLLRFGRRAPG
jgi:hypothetical protein